MADLTLNPGKFRDPALTMAGKPRATVALTALETLWINTGTLCNLTCAHCYIDSSPHNDRLVYLRLGAFQPYLAEIRRDGWPVRQIAFTGGEPFLNPDLIAMATVSLEAGFSVLILTNAMVPMQHRRADLLALRARYGAALSLRVSVDHADPARHEAERGPGTWQAMRTGLRWLADAGFSLAVAARTGSGESEAAIRADFARWFAEEGLPLDAADPAQLVIFPEMDATKDVPEISTECWDLLGRSPDSVMCAKTRMVVHRKGADRPVLVACPLLAYDPAFEMGRTLAEAARPVALNHPHCASFCVLGGAACSR